MSPVQSTRGCRSVTLEQLAQIVAPVPDQRWRPVGHSAILGIVESALKSGGYTVANRRLHVFRSDDTRFVAVLDLADDGSNCSSLVVGLTNSYDRSLPFSFFAGHRSRVTGCATFRRNLSAKCKHTNSGLDRFTAEVRAGVGKLVAYRRRELKRIERMKGTPIEPHTADSLILRAFEGNIMPSRALRKAIREWRAPKHETFAEPTYWSFEAILASVLEKSATLDVWGKHVRTTMRLSAMIDSDLARIASEAALAS